MSHPARAALHSDRMHCRQIGGFGGLISSSSHLASKCCLANCSCCCCGSSGHSAQHPSGPQRFRCHPWVLPRTRELWRLGMESFRGTGRAGSGLLKLGSGRREREGVKEPVNWREVKDAEPRARLQREKFSLWEKALVGPQEGKPTCFTAFPYTARCPIPCPGRGYRERWSVFPCKQHPSCSPTLALCLQRGSEAGAGWGTAGAQRASCRLPAPHLLSERREGRSICLWASVEPRLGCACSWEQREAVPGSLEWLEETEAALLMQSSAA